MPIIYKTLFSFLRQAITPSINPINPKIKPAMKIPIKPQVIEIIPRVELSSFFG